MKILKLNCSEHTYGKQVRIKHSTIAMLTITMAVLTVIEEVIVVITIWIIDKDVLQE